jgi:hypothetical protein
MKKQNLFFWALGLLPIFLSSCVTTFQGEIFQSGFTISDSDFKIIRTEKGSTKAIYVFGIGGNKHEGLILEAKQDLYRKCKLDKNQQITNITTDVRNSGIFYPIVITQTVTISADIIQFYPRNTSENQKETSSEAIIIEKKLSVDNDSVHETIITQADINSYFNKTLGAISLSKELKTLKYSSIAEVNVGEYVKVTTINGLNTQVTFGQILRKINKNTLVIEFETNPGTFKQEQHNFSECEKVISW